MKILIVSQYFWPENFKINDLAKGLIEKGHEVTVFTGLPNYPQGNFFKGYGLFGPYKEKHLDGYCIYRCPLIPRFKGRGFQLAINYLSFVFFGSLWALFLSRKSFDKIFVYEVSPITVAFPAIVIKKLKNIPIFFWVTDLWPESLEAVGAIKNPHALRLIGKMVQYIYNQCDYILMASRAFKSSIQSFDVPEHKLLYFPQWAEDFYQPLTIDPLLPQFVGHEKNFKLIFAGNLGEAQSFETLIKAAEILKGNTSIHWYILGDGRKKAWAQEEVRRLQLENNVHFLGSFPPEKMSEFFFYADALIVSLKRTKIFELTIPAKIQSYLACAKPILASLDGEGARIIEEAECGFTSPAENASKLADNVIKIKQTNRTTMCQKSKNYSDANFQRDKQINALVKYLLNFV